MPGGTIEGLFEVTQWDPPSRYAYRSVRIAFPVKLIDPEITLAENDGGTELRLNGRFELASVLRLLEGLLVKLAEQGDAANLAAAQRLLGAD